MKLGFITESEDRELLVKLCKSRSYPDRIKTICDVIGHGYEVHQYKTGVNIYMKVDAGKEKTIAITSHHDIVNPDSDNCLDNNASVLNVIKLYHEISAIPKENLKYNIVFGIVDEEEPSARKTRVAAGGVMALVKKFKINQLLDLELTATGSNIIITKYGKFDMLDDTPNLFSCRQPPNNADALYYYNRKDIEGSACIALLRDSDLELFKNGGFPETWRQCHGLSDTVDWADIDSMSKLRKILIMALTVG